MSSSVENHVWNMKISVFSLLAIIFITIIWLFQEVLAIFTQELHHYSVASHGVFHRFIRNSQRLQNLPSPSGAEEMLYSQKTPLWYWGLELQSRRSAASGTPSTSSCYCHQIYQGHDRPRAKCCLQGCVKCATKPESQYTNGSMS